MTRHSAPASVFQPSAAEIPAIATANPIWSPLTLTILLAVVGVGAAVFLGLLQISSGRISVHWSPEVAPAAIPFKADASSCEESGRVWQEEQCLDYTHDSTF